MPGTQQAGQPDGEERGWPDGRVWVPPLVTLNVKSLIKLQRNQMHPKVFHSHAYEDKNRFVIESGEKLCNKGINVWLDKWEMLPGESLVDKIFEEGSKNAEAIIIVLSGRHGVGPRYPINIMDKKSIFKT